MSGKRFQAKAKTVQKLSRDGLVEQNKATGEEKRVSQRAADISFGPDRAGEQTAGHHAAQRGGSDPAASAKKRRKQPRPVRQTAEEAAYATPEPASVPEVPVPDAPSMRMAADAPMMAAPTDSEEPSPPPASRKRRKRNNRKKTKQRQAAKHTPDAARSPEDRPMRAAGDAPMQNRPPGRGQKPPVKKRPPRPVEGGGRLKFDAADGEKPISDS
ncbi:MAG: peptidase M24, partial [Dysosmobacter sp.]|nr:peptidase M24 [Dysosmobacter sp.]